MCYTESCGISLSLSTSPSCSTVIAILVPTFFFPQKNAGLKGAGCNAGNGMEEIKGNDRMIRLEMGEEKNEEEI